MKFLRSGFFKLTGKRSMVISEIIEKFRVCQCFEAISDTYLDSVRDNMRMSNIGQKFRDVQTQHNADADYGDDQSNSFSPSSPQCVWIFEKVSVLIHFLGCDTIRSVPLEVKNLLFLIQINI